MDYLTRVAELTLRRYLNAFPVVGVTGPRQSGKSTLLRHMLSEYQYITFDDPKHRLAFQDDPEGFLQSKKRHVIFDEVQYVPEIFNHIKLQVDDARLDYGNFILTGSSQFQFLRHVTESLAGRMGMLSLLPFQYSEMPKALRRESVFQGAYPELVMRHYAESSLWYAAYLETYLSKDVRAIANIGDIRDFHRFIQLLAANVSQLFDMSAYARDLGVSAPTIKRWLSILEASYIVFTLQPFYENYGKRIIKSPKVYFYDTGLVSYLTGITTFEQYDQGPLAGSLFENYVVSEIAKKELHTASHAALYFLRTQDKAEIDLIVDRKTGKTFIEIKKSATFHPKMLRALMDYASPNNERLVLYNGEAYEHRGIRILPFGEYLAGS
jgi:predicted AAA+ superfamily ATPase